MERDFQQIFNAYRKQNMANVVICTNFAKFVVKMVGK